MFAEKSRPLSYPGYADVRMSRKFSGFGKGCEVGLGQWSVCRKIGSEMQKIGSDYSENHFLRCQKAAHHDDRGSGPH